MKVASVAGVDVSQQQLDVCLLPLQLERAFPNTRQGIQQLQALLRKHHIELVCCEATGGLETLLVRELQEASLAVAVANPNQVRAFARAAGVTAKTDRLDARTIAHFALAMQPRTTRKLTETAEKLQALVTRRDQVQGQITREKNRLSRMADAEIRKLIKQAILFYKKQLAKLDEQIKQTIAADQQLQTKAERITSAPGVGATTAAVVLARLPEIGETGRGQVASLAGLAPRNRDSGQLRGKRTTGGGRSQLRRALYMPTLVAIKHNPHLKACYQRLLANGKSKMTALIACMRKLLVLLNTLVKNNTPWKSTKMD